MTALRLQTQLEKKLYLIYSLNVVDWLCTLILLASGQFYEANPISRLFIGSPAMGFVMKVAAPLLIVVFIRWACEWLDPPELRITDQYVSFVLTFYLMILSVHAINFVIWASGGIF